MIKNIIFDWSGTLSDDIMLAYKAAMIVFESFGVKRISFKKYRREFELPYMKFYGKYITDVSRKEMEKVFSKAIHSVGEPKPFPQVSESLEFLYKKGIKLAILSAVPQKKLEKEVKDYGFSKFFVCVKGNVHDKTDEILEIINKSGFNEKETVYIGDMVHDIEIGKKAKVTTVAVSWGYQSREKLSKANPDFIIENLEQLKKIIS